MKKTDFLITSANCIGDHEHNDYIEILLDKIEFDQQQCNFLSKFFRPGHYSTGNWIFNDWTKKELKKLNTILRFYKNYKTLPAKIQRFQNELNRGCIYAAMLNNYAHGKIISYWLDYLEGGK